MNLILIAAAVFVAVILWYALAGRAWLKAKPWAQGFFVAIEPFEIFVFQKSETILVSRLLELGSLIVASYDAIAVFVTSYDMTPVTTRVFDALHIPPDVRGVTMAGFVFVMARIVARLRKRTTKPLEVVAVATADVTPQVARALAAAEVTKQTAVAAVVEAGKSS